VSEHWSPPKATAARIAELRKRDKGRCWLCNRPMHFSAVKNDENGATVEHLIPQCREGPDIWDNLVLCHRRCNQELRDLPLSEKIRMREERRQRDWLCLMRKQITKVFSG
jgi:5-methylcytosine-specific restriction endonuclease McrA